MASGILVSTEYLYLLNVRSTLNLIFIYVIIHSKPTSLAMDEGFTSLPVECRVSSDVNVNPQPP